jgi:multidrug efflux system membrane fusion protein
MSATRKLLLAVAILLPAAGGAWYFLRGETTDAARKPAAPPPVPVRTAPAEVRDLALLLEVQGRSEAPESVTVKARVEGQVKEVLFADGQPVRRGEALLRLDAADFQARLRQAEANLARDRALLAKARADAERYAALRAKGFVSEEKLNDVRTAEAAAAAAVEADSAAVELARLQLEYTVLRAPIDGIVGARLVFPGSAVKVNETALAVVNRVQPIHVAFAVAEKHLPRLRAGLAGRKPPQALISLPGDSGEPLAGPLRFLDNAVDTATGTIQMKAALPNADGRLLPGQFVNVAVPLETLGAAVTVPADAVQQGPEGAFVYVVEQEVATLRKIELAAMQKGVAAVAKGLAGGERVVTEGQLRLKSGSRVKPAGADRPAK